ncbi:hypothetical protein [Aeromonas popoffii]|uniref:hypothetical protein n=1 Tax=Aeromonas popoffii TaxID=70856 RepID=UPI0030CEBCCB
MNEQDIQQHAINLSNWVPVQELPVEYPQFTYSQVKTLFWKRDRILGLNRCVRMAGKRMYVCRPLFGAWLAGLLPEQRMQMRGDNS